MGPPMRKTRCRTSACRCTCFRELQLSVPTVQASQLQSSSSLVKSKTRSARCTGTQAAAWLMWRSMHSTTWKNTWTRRRFSTSCGASQATTTVSPLRTPPRTPTWTRWLCEQSNGVWTESPARFENASLDEPTNYLDRDGLGALSLGLQEFGGGVVIISHNTEFCDAVCTQKWIMDAGRLREEGEIAGDDAMGDQNAGPDEIFDASGNKIEVNRAKAMSDKDKKRRSKTSKNSW